MGDVGDDFRAWDKAKKDRRLSNKYKSTLKLEEAGIDFNSNNGGLHLKVYIGDRVLDFWPSTGLIMEKGNEVGRGVGKILKLSKQQGSDT